jgi:selenoprotein W-related protein
VLEKYKQEIKSLTLVPGSGGCYELTCDGDLVYSKLQTGEFPDEEAMVDAVGQRLGA